MLQSGSVGLEIYILDCNSVEQANRAILFETLPILNLYLTLLLLTLAAIQSYFLTLPTSVPGARLFFATRGEILSI